MKQLFAAMNAIFIGLVVFSAGVNIMTSGLIVLCVYSGWATIDYIFDTGENK